MERGLQRALATSSSAHAPRCGSPKGGEGEVQRSDAATSAAPLKHMQLAAVLGMARPHGRSVGAVGALCSASGRLGRATRHRIRTRPCARPRLRTASVACECTKRGAPGSARPLLGPVRSGPCRVLVAAAWIPALSRWRRKGRERASIRRRGGGAVCNALHSPSPSPSPTTDTSHHVCIAARAREPARPPSSAPNPPPSAPPRNPPMCTPLRARPR